MSNDNKTPTLKQLRKISVKGSASGFFAAHRETLLAQMPNSKQIFAMLDSKQIFPAEAAIKLLPIFDEAISAQELEASKAKIAKKEAKAAERPDTNYFVEVCDENGNVIQQLKTLDDGSTELVELSKGFELPQRANDWAERRLVEVESNAYALIHWLRAPEGSPSATQKISRSNAACAVFKRENYSQDKNKIYAGPSGKNGTLSFGVRKTNGTRVTFSKG